MVGYAEDERQEVYLAEIKSQLHQEGIDQILDDLRQLPPDGFTPRALGLSEA